MQPATPFEVSFWEATCHAMGQRKALALTEQRLTQIRADILKLAYHEVGHLAVTAFLEDDFDQTTCVSIVPSGDRQGAVVGGHLWTPERVAELPPELRWWRAWRRMMVALGGWCAERRAAHQPVDRGAVRAELHSMEGDPLVWDCDKGAPLSFTDFGRAWRLADLLAAGGWPRERRLAQGAAWTAEVLAVPEVWTVVEAAATELMGCGTIEDQVKLHDLFAPVLGLFLQPGHWRKWRPRFDKRPQLPDPQALPWMDQGPSLAGLFRALHVD